MVRRCLPILFAVLPLFAAAPSPAVASPAGASLADRTESGVRSLEGIWKVRAGDDPAWARPDYDDSGWRDIRVPTGRGIDHQPPSELAWYRMTVRLASPPGERRELGLTLGKVDSAYQVYAGGILLGQVGSLPPEPRMEYDRHRTYEVPRRAITPDGRLVVALRVWKSPARRSDIGGPYSGPFLIGDLSELVRRQLVSELPALLAAWLVLAAGLLHLLIYRRRPDLAEYLWFCLLAACAAAYSMLRTQWKYALTDDFLLLKEVEHLTLYLLPVLFIQMMWPFLGLRIGPLLRSFQWLCLAAGTLVAATPGLELNARVHRVWMPVLAVLIAGGLWTLLREAWRGRREARTVAAGAIAACAAGFHDLAAYRGWLDTPNLIPYGHAFLVLAMAFSLADRFIRAFSTLETNAAELRRVGEIKDRLLDERTAQISEHRRWLAERERLITELEAKNAELERFTYTVSHDLKSPLVTIKGFLGFLERDVDRGDRERAADDVRRIARSADKMWLLLEDLLELSRVGRVANPAERVAVIELVREAIERTAGLIAEREAKIEIAPDLPSVSGDRVRLMEVFQNLIENAVKHAGDHRALRVEVGWRRDGEELLFTVRDNGPGIEPRYHDKVFGLFERLEAAAEGTGVGLALVKRIVEVHGGRIWVESEGVGRGAVFCFTLPTETGAADRSSG